MNDRPNIPCRDLRPPIPIINGEAIPVDPEQDALLTLSPEAVRLILAWQVQTDRNFLMVDLIHMGRDPEGPKDREANLEARKAALSLQQVGQALGVALFRINSHQLHTWIAPFWFTLQDEQALMLS